MKIESLKDTQLDAFMHIKAPILFIARVASDVSQKGAAAGELREWGREEGGATAGDLGEREGREVGGAEIAGASGRGGGQGGGP